MTMNDHEQGLFEVYLDLDGRYRWRFGERHSMELIASSTRGFDTAEEAKRSAHHAKELAPDAVVELPPKPGDRAEPRGNP